MDSWTASGPDWELEWTKDEPHLLGTPEIVIEVQRYVFASEELAVTPMGPWIRADLSDPMAVVVAVSSLYADVVFDNAPDPVTLWIDVVPEGGDVVF